MYQSALSGLMYAMLVMCPDLAYAVGALSKHAACPGQAHFAVLKRVYHYLHGTMDTCLVYRKMSELSLLGYVDADWAGDINDCRSISGYTFITAGGAISWSSKKQPSVALSSTEAEYMATAATTKEATWLKVLFSEIEPSLTCTAIKLFIDNQLAMSLLKNTTFHDWMKHIMIHHLGVPTDCGTGHQHTHETSQSRETHSFYRRYGFDYLKGLSRRVGVWKFPVPTVPFSFILSMDTPSIPYIIMVILYRMFFFHFVPQSLFAQKY